MCSSATTSGTKNVLGPKHRIRLQQGALEFIAQPMKIIFEYGDFWPGCSFSCAAHNFCSGTASSKPRMITMGTIVPKLGILEVEIELHVVTQERLNRQC